MKIKVLYKRLRMFFRLLGGQAWHKGVDKPTFWQRVYKWRIGPGTAWRISRPPTCAVIGCNRLAGHNFYIMGDRYQVCHDHLDRNVPPTFMAHYAPGLNWDKVRTIFRYLGRLNYNKAREEKPKNRLRNRIGWRTAIDIATIIHNPIEKLEHHRKPKKNRDMRPV